MSYWFIRDILHEFTNALLLNVLMFVPIGLALPFVLKRPSFGHDVKIKTRSE